VRARRSFPKSVPECNVSYDRDEWRRPWRAGDGAGPSTSSPTSGAGAGEAQGRPLGSWERPDGSDAVAPVAGVDPEEPITRFPQPPPPGWDDRAAGPGSPSGSVRPPDTTGTVDAPSAPRRRRGAGAMLVLGAILGALVATAAVLAVTGLATDAGPEQAEEPVPAEPDEDDDQERVSAPSIEPLSESSIVPAVAEAVTPSVVRLDVSLSELDEDPLSGRQQGGLGSGVIFSSDGFIITNHHVVEDADDITVRLSDGEILDAEVVGSDELNDIAVVRVDETEELPAINLRDNEEEPVQVGETVVAIGSPFGLDASVSAGIISALNREIQIPEGQGPVEIIPGVVQTDAAINPGNSGGALVDAQGRLVGINTAILSRTGASQGVGFAVSADQAISSAEQLIDQGFVRQPLLGVAGESVTPDLAEEFDLTVRRGAIVASIQEGTGAAESDLQVGDHLVQVDGEDLVDMADLVREVRTREPGEVIELGVVRNGETLEIEIEIGERPRDEG
jgi:S1-C subfamily serine protease